MTRCSHPDCERTAVGSEQRQTATMPAPGFYPYCAEHLTIRKAETTRQELRVAVEALIAAASERVDDDDAYWERVDGVGLLQDSDSSEHSGYLLGIRAGLEIANQLLVGRVGLEWLIRHQIPEPHEVEVES